MLPGIGNKSPCTVVDYKVKFDLHNKGGATSFLSQAISLGPSVSWVFPSDPAIDLAITPFGLDQSIAAVLSFPSTLFLTDDQARQNRVVEGDSVVFTGLFIQFLGQQKIQPIVREGKIAMIPDEPVPTTLKNLGRVYLVDAHVFGGNSGAPVLVSLAGQRDMGLMIGTNYKLLGLVSGYVQENSEFSLQAVAGYAGTVLANSGIAMVVPAQQMIDLLDTQVLKDQRQQSAAFFRKQ